MILVVIMDDLGIEGRVVRKRVLGVPLLLSSILVLGMVVSGGLIYYYIFNQEIVVTGTINPPPKTPLLLEVSGDLNPSLNCTIGEVCLTSNISIYNPTEYTQPLKIDVNVKPGLFSSVTLYNINNHEIVINDSLLIGTTYISYLMSKQNLTFYVGLRLKTTDDKTFQATIRINSNMTQEYTNYN
jgi:hypothetical protein